MVVIVIFERDRVLLTVLSDVFLHHLSADLVSLDNRVFDFLLPFFQLFDHFVVVEHELLFSLLLAFNVF